MLEAGAGEGGAKTGEGEGFVFGSFGANEADGATYGGGADRVSPGSLGLLPEIGQDARDEVFEGVGPAEDLGGGKALDRQVALERLDEAAGGQAFGLSGQVACDGSRAGRRTHAAGYALEEEDGAETGRPVVEAEKIDLAIAAGTRDRAVSGAEVDTDGGVFRVHGRAPFEFRALLLHLASGLIVAVVYGLSGHAGERGEAVRD